MGDAATAILAMLTDAAGVVDGRSGAAATASAAARTAVAEILEEPDSSPTRWRIGAAGVTGPLARPNVIFQGITTGRTYTNDGPAGLARPDMQLSCYADDYEGARALAAAVRVALNGFHGVADGVTVQSILLDDEQDAPQPPATGQGQSIAGVVLMFKVACDE